MTTLVITVREIPASTTHPFRIFVDNHLVFEDVIGNSIKQIRVTLPPQTEIINLRVIVAEHDLDETREYNIMSHGKHIAIFSEEEKVSTICKAHI